MAVLQSNGGISCDFVEKVPALLQLECPICLLTVREPHLVACCGYRYCKTCINKIIGKSEIAKCPLCRRVISMVTPDKLLERTVDGMQVYCTHRNVVNGCQWTGELKTLDQHLNSAVSPNDPRRYKGCQVQPIKCTHCHKCIRCDAMEAHEDVWCPRRPIICIHCKKFRGYSIEVVSQHMKSCSDFLLSCLCGATVKHARINQHIADVCPQTIIECEYAHAGCKEKLPRVKMPVHLTTDATEHVQLLSKALSDQKLKHKIELSRALADQKLKHESELSRALADQKLKHESELKAISEEKHLMQNQVKILQRKLQAVNLQSDYKEQTIDRLQNELKISMCDKDKVMQVLEICFPELCSEEITVETERCVLISNLTPADTMHVLKSLLGQFGRIHSIYQNCNFKVMAIAKFVCSVSVDYLMQKYRSSGVRLRGRNLEFLRITVIGKHVALK